MKDRIFWLAAATTLLGDYLSQGFLIATPTTQRNDHWRSHQLWAAGNEKDDAPEDMSNGLVQGEKSKTRLAQLAEDWLEEEEDELLQYWERFDAKEVATVAMSLTSTQSSSQAESTEDDDTGTSNYLTTEERLERYFDRRGINKQKEREHAKEIEAAIEKAQKAVTPQQAIAAIQEVRPWLQVNTRLGGTALVELAIALWQNHDEEQEKDMKSAEDGPSNNDRDEALLLCQELLGNPHVNQRVRKLVKNHGPPNRQKTNLWSGFFNGDATAWWN
jgi:hypothetical protein